MSKLPSLLSVSYRNLIIPQHKQDYCIIKLLRILRVLTFCLHRLSYFTKHIPSQRRTGQAKFWGLLNFHSEFIQRSFDCMFPSIAFGFTNRFLKLNFRNQWLYTKTIPAHIFPVCFMEAWFFLLQKAQKFVFLKFLSSFHFLNNTSTLTSLEPPPSFSAAAAKEAAVIISTIVIRADMFMISQL